MMAESNGYFDDQTLQAPPGLVAALKALPTGRVFIPPTLDEAVLRAAQRHLTKRASPAFNWFRLRLWVSPPSLAGRHGSGRVASSGGGSGHQLAPAPASRTRLRSRRPQSRRPCGH